MRVKGQDMAEKQHKVVGKVTLARVRRRHKSAYRKLGPVTGHGLSGITGVATKAISEINFHSFEPLAKLQFDLESEAHGL